MHKKSKALHERRGLEHIDPDASLNAILDLTSFAPRQETLEMFFPEREKFYRLHRWIEGQIFDHSLSGKAYDDQLAQEIKELSDALNQLANNKTANFFIINKQKGNRSQNLDQQAAVLCAVAAYNDAKTRDQNTADYGSASRVEEINRWWRNLRAKSNTTLPAYLNRKLDNIEQEEGETKNKSLLAAYNAAFIDATDDEAKEHSRCLRQYAELILLP